MVSKYKCNFCGAPRLRTDNICKFCGQKFLDENNSSLNIRFKNYFSFLKDNKKVINSFRKAMNFSYKDQGRSKFKESFLHTYQETSGLINKSGKNFSNFIFTSGNDFSKFVSNNSKLILVSFLGLISLIITAKSTSDYVTLQETKRNLKDYLSGLSDLNLAIKECLKGLCYPNEPYIEKGNIQFLLDDTQSACRSWNQGKEKDWENQFKLEHIGNESVYNIYQNSCI